MIIDVPFGYTSFITLRLLFWLEGKREVDVNTLINHRNLVLNKAIQNHQDEMKSPLYNEELDDWRDIEGFEEIDYTNELKNFLNEYSKICSLEGTNIILKENVNLEDFDEILFRHYEESNRFMSASNCKESYDMLGISKLKDALLKCIMMEGIIEIGYKDIDKNNDYDKSMTYLKTRHNFLNFIQSLSYDNLDALSEVYYNQIQSEMKTNFYNVFQFDKEIDEEKELERFVEEAFNNYLENIAVFGTEPLHTKKIGEMISKDLFSRNDVEELEEEDNVSYSHDEFSGDIEKEFFVFYMLYAEKLKELIKVYKNPKLQQAYNRLIYVLDKEELCLFDNNRFNECLKKIKEEKIYPEDISLIYEEEACAILESILEKGQQDPMTLKKLVFVKIYYELSNDENIEKILEYNKNKKFHKFFSDYILNNRNYQK